MTRFKTSAASAALFCSLLVATNLTGQSAPPASAKLPDGTPVRLALDEDLNSATAQAGDTVHLEVAEDVRVGNLVVVPSGSASGGHVVVAEHKKRMGRGGKLDFAVDYVKLPDGSSLKVRASASREGKDKMGKVIAGTVLVSPLFLLMHGKDINIAKGTAFTAYVDGDREIALGGSAPAAAAQASNTQPAADPAPSADPSSQAPAPQAAEQQTAASSGDPATVVVKSAPDGADISLDGDYMGSTPSTLRMKPGHHALNIEKSGFKTWQRSLNVNPDETITVDASLDKAP